MSVGNTLRQVRGNRSQQMMSFELGVSRETVSSYETERSKIPKEIARKIVENYDDPFFVMAIASEYTGAWVRKLDGPKVDLHRSAIKEKVDEELEEVLRVIKSVSLSIPPSLADSYKRDKVEQLLLQSIDAIVALNHLVAVLSTDYNISWKGLWDQHTMKLISKGYLKNK